MDKIREETRLLIAFTLSIIIIFIFSKIQQSKYPYRQTTKNEQIHQEEKSTQQIKTEVSNLLEGGSYEFENFSYYFKIDKKYGYVKEIGLKKFLREKEKFFSLNEGILIFYNPIAFSENDYDIKILNNQLLLAKDSSEFYYLKKFLIPENDYIFYYEESFKNKTNRDIELKNYKNQII
ncbi:MAG: hypothetical protein NC816_05715, partial [Candidatus Omnitrophica bacterium]|nr:hypothetical protein [Candidatus Omnitrophota bacterium]